MLKYRFKQDDGNEYPDWESVPLKNLRNLTDRYSYTGGPFGSNLKVSDYTKSGVQVIQLQNIGDGNFKDDIKIYTSDNKANELLSCNIYPNDIIIAKMADPVARACLIPNTANRYLMASDGIRLSVDLQKYVPYFIKENINSSYFRKKAISKSEGSTRKRIKLSVLGNLTINIPCSEEQQKISDFLSAVDNQIDIQRQRVETMELQKKGLMDKVFSQELRFKQDDGSDYPAWEKDVLEHHINITSGKSPTNLLSKNGVIPFFKVEQLNYSDKYIKETPYFINYNEKNVVSKGCIVFPKRGAAIYQNKIRIFSQDSFMDTNLMALEVIDCNNEYLYYYLKQVNLSKVAEQNTVPQINNKHINPFSVLLPCPEEQQKIADFFTAIDNQIDIEKQRLTTMETIKKGLLQQMFC